MTVSGCLAKPMDMANLNIKVAQFTRDRGSLISSTETDLRSGQMAVATREITFKVSRMDSGLIDGLMDRSMLVTGSTTRSMGLVITSGLMGANTSVTGFRI